MHLKVGDFGRKYLLFLALCLFLVCVPIFGQKEAVSEKAPESIHAIKSLVPYEDLNKVLSQEAGKYIIIPNHQYEEMKAAKEAYLASLTAPVKESPPFGSRIVSAHLEGEIKGNFAYIEGDFSIESFETEWHWAELLRGSLAIASVTLDGADVSLYSNWKNNGSRKIQFGRIDPDLSYLQNSSGIPEKARHPGVFRVSTPSVYDISENVGNWPEGNFIVPLRGPGKHKCHVSFIVPIEKIEERYLLNFKVAQVPLTFFRLNIPDNVIALEEKSFKDFNLKTGDEEGVRGCSVIGWLGASGDIRLVWRNKLKKRPDETQLIETVVAGSGAGTSKASDTAAVPVKPKSVKLPPRPIVYARSETLITLGEAVLQGRMDIEYSITKAPVSSFTIMLPDYVDVVGVQADKLQTYQQTREDKQKRLVVDFMTGREDTCSISLMFETKMDNTIGTFQIPDVRPIGVERELGAIAIQALTSVEVQPGRSSDNPALSKVYRVDPTELPETLRKKTTRPILLSYRLVNRPINLELVVKRYEDLPQQTVVADTMDVKTTFTTHESSNTLISLKVRNNNRQYITFQLASGSEIQWAFRNNQPVKLVSARSESRVQIPLLTSPTAGVPQEMDLRVLVKQPVASMPWMGAFNFETPLVDIPVSHLAWTLYAPTQYVLYNFKGSVQSMYIPKDPFFFRGFISLYDWSWFFISDPVFVTLILIILGMILAFFLKAFFISCLEWIWTATCAVCRFLFTSKNLGLMELGIIMAIIGILAAIAVPNFRKAREQARGKACYANQRVLLGAVEMYNMDHSVLMKSADIAALRSGGYLKASITPPERDCVYLTAGSLDADGCIYCKLHGATSEDDEGKLKSLLGSGSSYGKKSTSSGEASRMSSIANPFGEAKTKGNLPIETKFVMTSNFYQLERDLVISDLATDGAIISNRTCPQVSFSFMRSEILQALKITSLLLGLLAGLYFIMGTYFNHYPRLILAVAIILVLSVWDMFFESLGDWANLGLWLAIGGGVIWKIGWFFSLQNISFGSNGNPPKSGSGRPGTGGPSGGGRGNPRGGVNFPEPEIIVQPMKDEDNDAPNSEPQDNGVVEEDEILPEPTLRLEPIKPGLSATLVLFLLSAGAAFGGSSDREVKIFVPFKDLSSVIETTDKAVIIPADDYRYLLDLGQDKVVPKPKAPKYCNVNSAFYQGRIEENGVRFNASFKIELVNDGWKVVKFLSKETVPSRALLDGNPITLDLVTVASPEDVGYGLITDAVGSKTLEITFFIPFQPAQFETRKFELPIQPVCLSSLEIVTSEKDCEAWVDPGVLSAVDRGSNGTVFKAVLPPTGRVRFELSKKVFKTAQPVREIVKPEADGGKKQIASDAVSSIVHEETRIIVKETNLIFAEEGFVKGKNKYTLEITGGDGVSSFSFMIPPKIRILKVDDKIIEDWKVEEIQGDALRRLNIIFTSQLKGKVGFVVEFEENVPNLGDQIYPVPELIPLGVDRAIGMIGVGGIPVFEIQIPEISLSYCRIDSSEFVQDFGGSPPAFAFKYLRHPNKMILSINRSQDVVQQTAVIDKGEAMTVLNEDGYLISRVVYEVKNNSEQFLKISLPSLNGVPGELWCSEVANLAVKAGFDKEFGVYNIPIIRSPMINGGAQPFPVEIVYAIKLGGVVQSMTSAHLEMPKVHRLEISEFSWSVYLPEGFELMRGRGNVDFSMEKPLQPLLTGQRVFSGLDLGALMETKTQGTGGGLTSAVADNVSGLLPVKFNVPMTSWWTAYTMQQIKPGGTAPYIDALLISPRKGGGRILQLIMIALGVIAGLALIFLLSGKRPILCFIILSILSGLLAIALLFKLYQADHSFKMGFLALFVTGIMYLFFRWNPDTFMKSLKGGHK